MSRQTEKEGHASEATGHLAELEPGRQPYPLFIQLARISTQPIIELIPVKRNADGNHQVLLTQRPADDEFWPNQWHIPGVVLVSGGEFSHDRDFGDAMDNIHRGELGNSLQVTRGPYLLGPQRRVSPRGDELSLVHWAEVTGEPLDGKFFDMNDVLRNPPDEGIVDRHDLSIARVAEKYHVVR